MKIFEIVSKDLEIWKYSDLFVIELCLMFAWYLPRVELNNSPDSVSSFREKGWTEKPLSPFPNNFSLARIVNRPCTPLRMPFYTCFISVQSYPPLIRWEEWRCSSEPTVGEEGKKSRETSSRTDNSPRTYAMWTGNKAKVARNTKESVRESVVSRSEGAATDKLQVRDT